jgi:hypothetical protein
MLHNKVRINDDTAGGIMELSGVETAGLRRRENF